MREQVKGWLQVAQCLSSGAHPRGEGAARKERGRLDHRKWGRQGDRALWAGGAAARSYLPVNPVLVALRVRRGIQKGQLE